MFSTIRVWETTTEATKRDKMIWKKQRRTKKQNGLHEKNEKLKCNSTCILAFKLYMQAASQPSHWLCSTHEIVFVYCIRCERDLLSTYSPIWPLSSLFACLAFARVRSLALDATHTGTNCFESKYQTNLFDSFHLFFLIPVICFFAFLSVSLSAFVLQMGERCSLHASLWKQVSERSYDAFCQDQVWIESKRMNKTSAKHTHTTAFSVRLALKCAHLYVEKEEEK